MIDPVDLGSDLVNVEGGWADSADHRGDHLSVFLLGCRGRRGEEKDEAVHRLFDLRRGLCTGAHDGGHRRGSAAAPRNISWCHRLPTATIPGRDVFATIDVKNHVFNCLAARAASRAPLLNVGAASTRSARAIRACDQLQKRVSRDDLTKRGIAPLVRPGQLLAAAEAVLAAPTSPSRKGVLIPTGFLPPRSYAAAESDGPPGAVALAVALLALGRSPVTLLIEDHSGRVRNCADAAGCGNRADIAAFPTADRWTALETTRLDGLRESACGLISIERAGEAADGVCYTMKGLPMGDNLLGKINTIAMPGQPDGVWTVGIGDGGNELGMGSLREEIYAHIPNGEKIGCVVRSDAPIVASISNWGGYALCCAIAVLTWEEDKVVSGWRALVCASALGHLDQYMPDLPTARATLHACTTSGALDGINPSTEPEASGSVDGLVLEEQLCVVEQLGRSRSRRCASWRDFVAIETSV